MNLEGEERDIMGVSRSTDLGERGGTRLKKHSAGGFGVSQLVTTAGFGCQISDSCLASEESGPACDGSWDVCSCWVVCSAGAPRSAGLQTWEEGIIKKASQYTV